MGLPHICVGTTWKSWELETQLQAPLPTTWPGSRNSAGQKLPFRPTKIVLCTAEKSRGSPRSTAATPDGDLWGEGGRMSLGLHKVHLCYHHSSSAFCHSFLCGSPNPHIPPSFPPFLSPRPAGLPSPFDVLQPFCPTQVLGG